MYETITINLMVDNVAETITFYEDKLGFKKVISVPEQGNQFDFAIISRDKVSIMFQEKKSLIEEYPTLEVTAIKPTFTLFITVNDVSALYEELKDNIKIAKSLHKTFYGKDEFAIFDNNDNILTISC